MTDSYTGMYVFGRYQYRVQISPQGESGRPHPVHRYREVQRSPSHGISEILRPRRFRRAFLFSSILSFLPIAAYAQWEVEADPSAYALHGYSAHVAPPIFDGKSRLQLGAFAAETPEWVHGNSGWTEKSHGVTFKFDYFPMQPLQGLFIGLDTNYARTRYTLQETNQDAYRNIVGVGPRIGYPFELGEHLYTTLWASIDY